ncbi:MAG: DUF4350 domain-containing protein [Egibacteraceae bacterium]
MSRATLRRALPVVAVLVLAVALAALTPRAPSGLPLDPRSRAAGGTSVLVDVLRELGAWVDVVDRVPTDGEGSLLIAFDFFDEAGRERVRRFALAGGTVLLLDGTSPLAPPLARPETALFAEPLVQGCDEPALRAVETLEVDAAPLETPNGATGCFVRSQGGDDAEDGGAWLVSQPLGAGRLITVGGPGPFQNAQLGEDDHALLAVTLLAPGEDARVRMLSVDLPAEVGEPTSLGELLPPATGPVLVGLLLAFLALVGWRARRLGRPVQEPPQVALPASGLVVANGELLARIDARAGAVELLRADLRRTLRQRLDAPETADDAELARLAGARTSADPMSIAALLTGKIPSNDGELVELAVGLERERARVLGGAASALVDA